LHKKAQINGKHKYLAKSLDVGLASVIDSIYRTYTYNSHFNCMKFVFSININENTKIIIT